MNQDRIDKIGVAAAVTYFCRLGYINPHITFDDKIAVWDGYLEVHKSKDSLSSDDIDFTIAVQVKSSERDSNNFPPNEKQKIKVSDLNHYKTKGGTLLVKVLVGRSKSQPYFAYLGKLELNKILEKCTEGQDEKTIDLVKAPKEQSDVRRKLKSIHLQGKHNLLSVEQLETRSDFQLHIEAGPMPKTEDPLLWMAANPVDILVSLPEFDEPFYMKEGPSFINTKKIINEPVEINGIVYFNSFEIATQRYGVDIRVGNFLKYSDCEPKDNYKIANMKLTPNSPNIKEYIRELEFVLAFGIHKYFTLGGKKIPCPDIVLNDKYVKSIKQRLDYCRRTLSLFELLKLEPNFNLNNLSDKEQESLDILINCLLGSHSIEKDRVNTPIHIFAIAGYKIAVAVAECGDVVQMVDINRCRAIRRRHIDGYLQDFPLFSYCLSEDCMADNIDFSNFIGAYESAYESSDKDFLTFANFDALALIKLYDESDKNKDLYLLKALELSKWLMSKANENSYEYNVYLLNSLQCKMRLGEQYTDWDTSKLNELVKDANLSLPANILLGNREEADRAWNRLDDDSEKSFKTFPIYNLYKKLSNNNNNG